jgi:hypothetical protein
VVWRDAGADADGGNVVIQVRPDVVEIAHRCQPGHR